MGGRAAHTRPTARICRRIGLRRVKQVCRTPAAVAIKSHQLRNPLTGQDDVARMRGVDERSGLSGLICGVRRSYNSTDRTDWSLANASEIVRCRRVQKRADFEDGQKNVARRYPPVSAHLGRTSKSAGRRLRRLPMMVERQRCSRRCNLMKGSGVSPVADPGMSRAHATNVFLDEWRSGAAGGSRNSVAPGQQKAFDSCFKLLPRPRSSSCCGFFSSARRPAICIELCNAAPDAPSTTAYRP